MDYQQIESLISKLQSNVNDEIRSRALNTLVTKYESKLMDLDEVCQLYPEFSSSLLYWIQDFYPHSQHLYRALTLLNELTKRSQTLMRMRQSSAPTQFLCVLREWMVLNKQPMENINCIDRIIAAIVDKENQQFQNNSNNVSIDTLSLKTNLNNKRDTKAQTQATSFIQEYSNINNVGQQTLILQKPQVNTIDYILLPPIKLLEMEEKLLFDVQVQLKFGNTQTIVSTLRDQVPFILKDIPIEVLKMKYELVDGILGLVDCQTKNVSYYASTALITIIKKIDKRIKLSRNSYFQNAYTNLEAPRSEMEDYLTYSYPTLDSRYYNPDQKDIYLEQTINQKSLKYLVEGIAVGILKTSVQQSGQRLTLFSKILNLMKLLLDFNIKESAYESIITILKKFAGFFDTFEVAVKDQICLPLLLVAAELFMLLPEDQCNSQDLNRICTHLSQVQFSSCLSQERSHELLCRLASMSESDAVVQSGRVEQIISSVVVLHKQKGLLSKEVLCLSKLELQDLLNILKDSILSIPIAETKLFLRNYIISYLYCILLEVNEETLAMARENLLNVIYVPCPTSQQILFSTILQQLSNHQPLKHPKNTTIKDNNIGRLTRRMLENETILLHLFQSSLRSPELYKTMLDILICLMQMGPPLQIIFTFASVIISNRDQYIKQTDIIITLLAGVDSKVELLKLLIQSFAIDHKQRKQASSALASRTYCSQLLAEHSSSAIPISSSELHTSNDFFEEFLNEEQIAFQDNIGDQIKSLILRQKSKTQQGLSQIDVQIEQISNLESIVQSQDLEISLKAGAVQQLTELYIKYIKDESSFSKAVGVKVSQLRSYWEAVIENLLALLVKEWQDQKIYIQTQISYVTFILNIIEILTCYQLFGPIDDQLNQSINAQALFNQNNWHYKDILQCCLHYIRSNQIIQTGRFTALRFIFVSLFRQNSSKFPQITCKREKYLQVCLLPDIISKSTLEQNWSLYYPLSANAEWFVCQYIECLRQNVSPQDFQSMRAKVLAFNKTGYQLSEQIDYVVGLQSLDILVELDVIELEKMILSPVFLGSGDMYLLKQISKLPNNPIKKLQAQIIIQIEESVGQDQIELIALHFQLCYLTKQQPALNNSLINILKQHPYHDKTALYTVLLLKRNLIQQDKRVITYLCQHCLSQNALRFQQCHLPILFLNITRGLDLMEGQEDVDKHIIFNQLAEYSQSHITLLRSLSLSHLKNHLQYYTKEQTAYLVDSCVNILYQPKEAQLNYSIAIQILCTMLDLEYKDDMIILLTAKKILSHCQSLLQLENTIPFFKGSVVRLIVTLLDNSRQEFTPQIHATTILQILTKTLIQVVRGLNSQQQIDEAAYFITNVIQLFISLLRQSVHSAMQLLQSSTLVEQCNKLLHQISKIVNRDIGYTPIQIQNAFLELCKFFQLCSHMHPDLVCLDLKQCKNNIFRSLQILIRNDIFDVESRLCIANTITFIVKTGFNDLCQQEVDIVQCLKGIYDQVEENQKVQIVQSVSCLISQSNEAKAALLQTKFADLISIQLSNELESYIFCQTSPKQITNKSKKQNLTQSFSNSNTYGKNELIRCGVLLLKTLYAKADSSVPIDTKLIQNTIEITLQILQKLLLLSQQHQLAIDHFKWISINLASNDQLQQVFVQKVTEIKQTYLIDLVKFLLKNESISIELFDGALSSLGVLGQNAEFRLIFYRLKVIEELVEKLYKIWEKKRQWQPGNQFAQSISHFLLSLSFHKEAQPKIIGSSKIMSLYVDIVRDHGLGFKISQNLILILVNCAVKHKTPYFTNESLPALMLSLITEEKQETLYRLQGSQLLVNLMYKSTQAISLFNRPEVIEELEVVMKSTQRQTDKVQIETSSLTTQIVDKQKNRKQLQDLTNNLHQLLKVLRTDW